MKKKITERAICGFFIGIAIGQIISIIISMMLGTGEYVLCAPEFVAIMKNEVTAAAIQTLLCGIMGAGFAAASIIWEIDNLSIAAQSGICLGIYALIMFPIAYITNWMEHSLTGFISYAVMFFSIFIIIWISQYMIWKKKLKAINRKIQG